MQRQNGQIQSCIAEALMRMKNGMLHGLHVYPVRKINELCGKEVKELGGMHLPELLWNLLLALLNAFLGQHPHISRTKALPHLILAQHSQMSRRTAPAKVSKKDRELVSLAATCRCQQTCMLKPASPCSAGDPDACSSGQVTPISPVQYMTVQMPQKHSEQAIYCDLYISVTCLTMTVVVQPVF